MRWFRENEKSAWPKALKAQADAYGIPREEAEDLANWILYARPVGNFLGAILSNDLKEACKRADLNNQRKLWDYVNFLYNEAPANCWGSVDDMSHWMSLKGLFGQYNGTQP